MAVSLILLLEPKEYFCYPTLISWLEIQTGPLNLSNKVFELLLFIQIGEKKCLRFNMNM